MKSHLISRPAREFIDMGVALELKIPGVFPGSPLITPFTSGTSFSISLAVSRSTFGDRRTRDFSGRNGGEPSGNAGVSRGARQHP